MTRITQNMVARDTLRSIELTNQRMAKLQEQMATNSQINRPSDDPTVAARVMGFQDDLDAITQSQSNIAGATGWVQSTDAALGRMSDFLSRARTLTLQGATGTNSATARQTIANEITSIIEGLKAEANTKYNGEFIFAGTNSTTAPYQAGTNDAYAGNTGSTYREISPGVQVAINTPGVSILGDNTSGLLKSLRDIVTHLQGGTPADLTALQTTDIKALDAAQDALSVAQTTVGGLEQRFEFSGQRLSQLQETTMKLISDNKDADLAETYIKYSQESVALQSALKAGAQVIQPSLVDFLR